MNFGQALPVSLKKRERAFYSSKEAQNYVENTTHAKSCPLPQVCNSRAAKKKERKGVWLACLGVGMSKEEKMVPQVFRSCLFLLQTLQ